MYVKEIERTAVIAWGPSFQQLPFIATGTVSGALDASFSTNSELELFNVSLQERDARAASIGSVPCSARFNRLSWSPHEGSGIIAGGLEDGSVCLWSAEKIISGQLESCLIDSKSIYGGPVKGLSFSPHTPFLLAIGSVDAQLSLMDMHDTSRVYMPGPSKSQRLGDVSDLAWNPKVSHILAASSTNGVTVVWDLRAKKEALQFSVSGNQRGSISSISWNPDLPNQIVCASEDNSNPIIHSWDLRNAHSPDKALTGHSKGILSVDWCPKDSELLLSSAKDNRIIFWNPKTASIIGELPANDNWVFDVQWCPRNPDLLSTAGFDGKIDIFSFQSVSSSLSGASVIAKNDSILFDSSAPSSEPQSKQKAQLSAQNQPQPTKQVPKWLKCPVGARFGFGGRLAVFGPNSRKVALSSANAEDRKDSRLDITNAIASKKISEFCQQNIAEPLKDLKSGDEESVLWTVLKVLNQPDTKDQLLNLAGVAKNTLVSPSFASASPHSSISPSSAHQPPSSISTAFADAGSFRPSQEITPTSLAPPPQMPSSTISLSNQHHQDFFAGASNDEFDFTNSRIEPSSLLDDDNQNNGDLVLNRRSTFSGLPFSLYSPSSSPSSESNDDQKITRAIIAGNFKEAVELCISADRLSDALLVAVCGGPDLVARTQRIYFQKVKSPYLRVVSGILKKDLSDVIENASLTDWQDLFALILSFSEGSEQRQLLEALADRLAVEVDVKNSIPSIVCYLVAGDATKSSALILKQAKRSMPSSKDITRYHCWLSSLLEKIRVVQLSCSASSDISLQAIVEQLPDLSKFTLHYAFLLCENGKFEDSAYYLRLISSVLSNISSSHYAQKSVALFVDRVAGLAQNSSLSGLIKPFEVLDIGSVQAASIAANSSSTTQQHLQQPHQQHLQYPTSIAAGSNYGQGQGASIAQPIIQPTMAYPQTQQPQQPQQAQHQTPYPQPYHQQQPSAPSAQPYPQASYSHYPQPQQSQQPAPPSSYSINQPTSAPFYQPTQLSQQPYPQSTLTTAQPSYPMQQQQQQQQPPHLQHQTPPQPQQRPLIPGPPMPIVSSAPYSAASVSPGTISPQQQQSSITAAEFSARRTTEGFNDAPIVAPKSIATARSPQPTSAPIVSPPSGSIQQQQQLPAVPGASSHQIQEKKQLGPPDVSKILPHHMPIYDAMTLLVQQCEQTATPIQKRSVDDASRRLGHLYSQLTYQALSDAVIGKLLLLSQNISGRNMAAALEVIQDLTTGHFAETGGWILGLRRLVELIK